MQQIDNMCAHVYISNMLYTVNLLLLLKKMYELYNYWSV